VWILKKEKRKKKRVENGVEQERRKENERRRTRQNYVGEGAKRRRYGTVPYSMVSPVQCSSSSSGEKAIEYVWEKVISNDNNNP
jgi:ribosomal protein S8E